MWLDTVDESALLQFLDHPGSGLESVQTAQMHGRKLVQARVGREYVDQGQAVALAYGVVIEVMRGRDLHAAAAERGIHVAVGDDRNFAPAKRQFDAPADQMPIALIVGVHGHGSVAEQGFRTRGGDDDVAIAIAQGIAQIPQLSILFL